MRRGQKLIRKSARASRHRTTVGAPYASDDYVANDGGGDGRRTIAPMTLTPCARRRRERERERRRKQSSSHASRIAIQVWRARTHVHIYVCEEVSVVLRSSVTRKRVVAVSRHFPPPPPPPSPPARAKCELLFPGLSIVVYLPDLRRLRSSCFAATILSLSPSFFLPYIRTYHILQRHIYVHIVHTSHSRKRGGRQTESVRLRRTKTDIHVPHEWARERERAGVARAPRSGADERARRVRERETELAGCGKSSRGWWRERERGRDSGGHKPPSEYGSQRAR